jgi:hypothetical protein
MDWNAEQVTRLAVNPYYAVTLAESLCTPHPPLISKDEWVQANVRLIDELGAEAWLRTLLDVLEAGA